MEVLGDSVKKAHQCHKYSFSLLSVTFIPGNGYLANGQTASFE